MMRSFVVIAIALAAVASAARLQGLNEVWTKEQNEAAGIAHKGGHSINPLPQDYIATADLPTNFTW